MAIATGTALALGGGALLGGIAGAMGSESTSTSGVKLAPESDRERYGAQLLDSGSRDLAALLGMGPGAADVSASYGAQTDLAAMLKRMAEQGPDSGDVLRGQNVANTMFRGRELALQNAFSDQRTQAAQQAALMGRSLNDPILAAKLAQEQTRQQGMLDAEKGAFGMNFAMSNRLNLMGQRAGILEGLASRALANRQTLAGLGEGIMNNERNFRLATAERWGKQESGGGFGGFLSGMLGGAGAGMGVATGFKQISLADKFLQGGGGFGGGGMFSGGSNNFNLGVNTNLGSGNPFTF